MDAFQGLLERHPESLSTRLRLLQRDRQRLLQHETGVVGMGGEGRTRAGAVLVLVALDEGQAWRLARVVRGQFLRDGTGAGGCDRASPSLPAMRRKTFITAPWVAACRARFFARAGKLGPSWASDSRSNTAELPPTVLPHHRAAGTGARRLRRQRTGGLSLLCIDGRSPGISRYELKKTGWSPPTRRTPHRDAVRVPCANLDRREEHRLRDPGRELQRRAPGPFRLVDRLRAPGLRASPGLVAYAGGLRQADLPAPGQYATNSSTCSSASSPRRRCWRSRRGAWTTGRMSWPSCAC